MAAGIYGGGGGGGASSAVGGGLMLRPHVDLLWDFDGCQAGISASNVRFPNGSINSSQLGLVLSADIDFSYFPRSYIGQRVEVEGRSGVGFDRVIVTPGVYREGQSGAVAARRFGFVGARMEQFGSPWWYRGIEVAGGASGGVAGYAEFLGTLGAELPVWDERLTLGTRLAAGMGGGGGVPVGGGALMKMAAYATVNLGRSAGLQFEGGYAEAPGGSFRATYGAANVMWNLDHPFAPGSAEVAGYEWVFGSDHYFGAAHKDGSRRNLDAVVIKINRYVTDAFYLTGQAHSAYRGGAGAYSAGMVGAGYHTPRYAHDVSAGAEFLVGAAGGGSVDTGGGAVMQPMVYLATGLTEQTDLRFEAGKIKAFNGALDSNIVGVSLSFVFGAATR